MVKKVRRAKDGKTTPLSEDWRLRIKTGMILNKVQNHIEDPDNNPMLPTQINAAKMLLAKIIPDLKAIEHSNNADNPFTFTVKIEQ